jgi:hypothetical protein
MNLEDDKKQRGGYLMLSSDKFDKADVYVVGASLYVVEWRGGPCQGFKPRLAGLQITSILIIRQQPGAWCLTGIGAVIT